MDHLDDQPRAIPILDIGGVDFGPDQRNAGIGHNMALTSLLLGRNIATRPAAVGRLDRLTRDHPGRRAGVAARRNAVSRGRPAAWSPTGSISAHSASVASLAYRWAVALTLPPSVLVP